MRGRWTRLQAGSPDANNSLATTLVVDRSPEQHILLRFDNIFGSNTGQIPPGSIILSAQLEINVTNSSVQGALLHRMLQTWSDTDTWSIWGSGINPNGTEAEIVANSSSGGSGTGFFAIDVTPDLQVWSNNLSDNLAGLGCHQPVMTPGNSIRPKAPLRRNSLFTIPNRRQAHLLPRPDLLLKKICTTKSC